ncbi:hypothetical protein [Kordia sp.]|uniref:hypothetical protein n=1 Tax=Kordia sp. TaxID=1965332 RepID=UPI0025BD366C|nr:hypothetical protein [Kordia sp.]MCH2196226.1 hypothetical protein [Kordia sp.]
MKIFKDNNVISTRRFTSSSCWFNKFYDNFQVSSVVYRAHIQLDVRGFFWSWSIQASENAGIINVTRQEATPSFTINGIIPNPEIPTEVCPAKILINPSDTSCEENYYMDV